MMRRVVITGFGIVSSIGNDSKSVKESLYEARSGVVFSPQYAELGFRSQVHGPVDLDWASKVDRKAARFLTHGTAYGHIAMENAIKDSGLAPEDVSNERTGLIVGSGGPSTSAIVAAAEITRTKGPKKIGPFAVPKAMTSGASAVLSTWFKIRGINYSISSACATSTHCIGAAAEQIALGQQDIMFAGGCEELDWTLSNLFDAMGAMSSGFNDRPGEASRPYDRDRDGFVIAGGAGIVVLENLEHAKARGAKIYGEITGYAANSDGYDMVAPSGEGAARCMRAALKGFGDQKPDKIDYINPHGTGTTVGDEKEIAAITEVFQENMPPISSTKALTGHSLGAAGVQEVIYCLLMMEYGFIAKSANIDNLDPAFTHANIIQSRIDKASLNTVLSNSFGFGGTNGCLIISRFDG